MLWWTVVRRGWRSVRRICRWIWTGADPDVAATFSRVKTAVESSGLFLRMRLLVGPSAQDLHAIRWELLRDPETKAPLATSEKILFSRFISSQDWRDVRLRPKAVLRKQYNGQVVKAR